MDLKILTPDKVVVEETGVTEVIAASTDGSFGVQEKHIPMVTPLKSAVLTYIKEGQSRSAAVMSGMFSTDGKNVIVLSEAAELETDIDFLRAEEAKKRAESRLSEKKDNLDAKRAEMALAKAMTRLKLKK